MVNETPERAMPLNVQGQTRRGAAPELSVAFCSALSFPWGPIPRSLLRLGWLIGFECGLHDWRISLRWSCQMPRGLPRGSLLFGHENGSGFHGGICRLSRPNRSRLRIDRPDYSRTAGAAIHQQYSICSQTGRLILQTLYRAVCLALGCPACTFNRKNGNLLKFLWWGSEDANLSR